MSAERLAAQHKQALVDLSTLTRAELQGVWSLLGGLTADQARDALLDMLPMLGEKYGQMAGSLAADFYDEVRAQAAVRGRFAATPAPTPGTARYEALVRWGVDPLYQGQPESLVALARLSGGLQKVVAGVARDTVTESAVRDPRAAGWKRVARAGSCKFCRMLADRGAVYREATVRFASHDNCGCVAAPDFTGGPQLGVMQYVASKRNPSEADRHRLRDYLSQMSDT